MLMDVDTFMEEILEVSGLYEPCTLLECDFTRNIATLDPGDNYSTQKRRWMVLHQNHLFMNLYKISCPHFIEDRTFSFCDVKQDYVNLLNVKIHLNQKENETALTRMMQPLISDAIPEACYGNLFIQGLTPAIKKRVEGSFSEHHGVTAMTRRKQVDILHNAIAATALCVIEEEVVTDLMADRTLGLLNMVQIVANNSGMVLPPSIVEVSQVSTSSGG